MGLTGCELNEWKPKRKKNRQILKVFTTRLEKERINKKVTGRPEQENVLLLSERLKIGEDDNFKN